MESQVKAYGKLLVFGSYAVLEPGNIGLVVNVDSGTTALAQQTNEGKVVIDLENFEISVYGARKGQRLDLNEFPDKLKFVKNAVEYSYQYLNHMRVDVKDVKLVLTNDPQFYIKNKIKTGFGSSATSTVATVAAILNLHGINDRDLVFMISHYAHYMSQGELGSGFDIAAACYGSHFFKCPYLDMSKEFEDYLKSEWHPEINSFDLNQIFIPVLIFTGQSSSTQNLVSKVLEFKRKHPARYDVFIKEYNEINVLLEKAFSENWMTKIKFFIEKSWEKRRELGELAHANIEPEKYSKLMIEMKDNGAFLAGLTGAGGGDTILALCKSVDDKNSLLRFIKKKKFTVLEEVSVVSREYQLIS